MVFKKWSKSNVDPALLKKLREFLDRIADRLGRSNHKYNRKALGLNKIPGVTQEGLHISIACNREEKQILFEGIAQCLPHAQIGYSSLMQQLYN